MTDGRVNIRLPLDAPRTDRSHKLDRDTEPGDWDYAAELYPPGALEPYPQPNGIAWAHHADAATRGPSPELTLCYGVWIKTMRSKRLRTNPIGQLLSAAPISDAAK